MKFNSDSPLKLISLDKQENRIGHLNPTITDITEEYELKGLRTIEISHPIRDSSNNKYPAKYLNLLNPGNKLFQQKNCDGVSVLYILHGKKEVDPSFSNITIHGTEVARELSESEPIRLNPINGQYLVNESFLNPILGNLFRIGEISADNLRFTFSGTTSPMGLLRHIESETGGEFQFRYEYSENEGKIIRYIDFLNRIGKDHTKLIKIGYNTENIIWSIDDTEVRTAAAPVGDVTNDQDNNENYHRIRKAWEDLEVRKDIAIPQGVTKDDQGNEVVRAYVKPPFSKTRGKIYVEADDVQAVYSRINGKEKSNNDYPRIGYFDTSEENVYNIYWQAAELINDNKTSEITIDAKVIDIDGLKGEESNYYNSGDTVPIKIKDLDIMMEGRIKSTIKLPRDRQGDSITIGTPSNDFIDNIIGKNKNFNSLGIGEI